MTSIDLLITPKWLAPVDKQNSTLENHSVAINHGEILEVGETAMLKQQYEAAEVVELREHLLTPGLINTHTHAAMTLFRGYADDLPLMQWLQEHIWPAEAKWVDESFVKAGTDIACAEMIRSGTTCFNDMYFFPDVVAKSAQQAGLRCTIGMIVIDFPTVWAENADEYIAKGLEVRDSVRHSNLVNAVFAPHAPYTVSDQPFEKIATLSDELDCGVHIHLHETAHEIEESTARYGVRPLERLEQLGLLSPKLMAVHMTQLLPGEIETLAQRGVHVVHCPEANMKLASGFCPVNELQKTEVNVALGTDSAASNNDLDMVSEMRSASLLSKVVANSATALDAYSTLKMATLDSARTLGLEHRIGSIEAGKLADLCAFNLSDIATQPVYNPVSQLIYSATRDSVTDLWVNGHRLLNERNLTTLEQSRISALALEWGSQIAS